jgi:hypothetical protein
MKCGILSFTSYASFHYIEDCPLHLLFGADKRRREVPWRPAGVSEVPERSSPGVRHRGGKQGTSTAWLTLRILFDKRERAGEAPTVKDFIKDKIYLLCTNLTLKV